jgi:hypothetical protein
LNCGEPAAERSPAGRTAFASLAREHMPGAAVEEKNVIEN